MKTSLSTDRYNKFYRGCIKLAEFFIRFRRLSKKNYRVCYNYPQAYKGPKPIAEQIKAIADLWSLDDTEALEYAKRLPNLPRGAEGYFAIPSINGIAERRFPKITSPAKRYCLVVKLALKKIRDSRPFENFYPCIITPDRLRVHTRTAQALDLIAQRQPGDILVVPAQFGRRHRDRTVSQARRLFNDSEFGMELVGVASMLLTHPNREFELAQLHINCAGNECVQNLDYGFGASLSFSIENERVFLGATTIEYVNPFFDGSSVTGFVPPSLPKGK